jgi:hypothetical protein
MTNQFPEFETVLEEKFLVITLVNEQLFPRLALSLGCYPACFTLKRDLRCLSYASLNEIVDTEKVLQEHQPRCSGRDPTDRTIGLLRCTVLPFRHEDREWRS